MHLPPVPRRRPARASARALGMLLVAGLLLAGVQLALLPIEGPEGALAVAFPLLFLLSLIAGLIAWARRPRNHMGTLIASGGFAVYLAGLANTGVPVLVGVGSMTATLVLAATVHLLHAFPSGALRGGASRWTVLLAYVNALAIDVTVFLLHSAAPADAAYPGTDDLAAAARTVQAVIGLVIFGMTAAVLVRRVVAVGSERRPGFALVYVYGTVGVVGVAVLANVLEPALGMTPVTRALLQVLLIGGVPIVFAVAVLRDGFGRTRELSDLGTWLGDADPLAPQLAGALAEVLGDPTLRLSFRPDGGGGTDRAPRDPSRGEVEIVIHGRSIGLIDYDAALIADPDHVRAAGRIVAIAVDRDRLTAELDAKGVALRRSRERIVDAADRERHRIAQDLHDGLQMQLVLLAIEAQQLASDEAASQPLDVRATRLREGIDAAAAGVRDLVHAVMPAALIEQGLAAAVEDLVDRMPVPTSLSLEVGAAPFSPAVRRTAYFVVAEALTNAVKHADATRASVSLGRTGDVLRIEVADDGVGGARANLGAGLLGLADRVDVLGGTMRVTSPRAGGTVITVELPCGS